MAGVLSRKRLQLLRDIIKAEGYADKDLSKDFYRGFDLVGKCLASGILPDKLVPATLQAAELQACARKIPASLKASLGSSSDHAADVELWGKTMAKVKEGWLQGPYVWWSFSYRFLLRQGAKLRPIDDYSLSGVNSCVATVESPTVDSADVAAAKRAPRILNLEERVI